MMREVYWNTHEKLFSVRIPGGVVEAHTNAIWLQDVSFVVQPAGRRKVLETGRKNVHAFLRGTPCAPCEGEKHVTYDPRRMDSFQADGAPVHHAACAVCVVEDGRPVVRIREM